MLVIERASGGGGTSAISSGIFYLGGGTALQRSCGVQDDPDSLYRFMLAACAVPDPDLLRRFCDGNVEHFDWLEAQGIPFERRYYTDKHMCPQSTEGLLSTGNEKVWPFREIATPSVRGHRVAREGDHAGSLAMEVLLERCEQSGVRVLTDAQCLDLLTDENGGVSGLLFRRGASRETVRARGAVILCTGGFQMNAAMVGEHAPISSITPNRSASPTMMAAELKWDSVSEPMSQRWRQSTPRPASIHRASSSRASSSMPRVLVSSPRTRITAAPRLTSSSNRVAGPT